MSIIKLDPAQASPGRKKGDPISLVGFRKYRAIQIKLAAEGKTNDIVDKTVETYRSRLMGYSAEILEIEP